MMYYAKSSCLVKHTQREKCPKRSFSGPNTGKYGLEKTPYLDSFHTAISFYINKGKL